MESTFAAASREMRRANAASSMVATSLSMTGVSGKALSPVKSREVAAVVVSVMKTPGWRQDAEDVG